MARSAPFAVATLVVRGYGPPRSAVHATATTDPSLGPNDVMTSLWEGGGVTATIDCANGDFVAATMDSG